MKKYIVISIMILISVLMGIFVSAQMIVDFLWLNTQGAFQTAMKLLVYRWLMIPIFGVFFGLLSLTHLITASKEEQKNYRFIFYKTIIIIIVAMIGEYFLHISEALIYTIFGGLTGKIDTLTHLDMSFYLFWLPLIKKLSLFFTVYFGILVFFRFIYPSKKYKIDKISFLISLFFAIISIIMIRLDIIIHSVQDGYIGYMDINGSLLPFAFSLIFTYIFVVIMILFLKFNSKSTAIGAIITAIVLIIANIFFPFYLKSFVYAPNLSSLQSIYAGIHADTTRKAFALDELIRDDSFVYSQDDLPKIMKKTFWQDEQHFLQAIQHYQDILPLFSINAVSPLLLKDKHGEFSPYFIASREIDENPNELWDIKHFRNIFGYGAIIGSATEFDKEGYSKLLLKDLTLNSSDPTIKLKNPQIFFSPTYNSYAFINTTILIPDFSMENAPLKMQTFHHIKNIPVNFFVKILLTIMYGDTRFYLTDYITKNTGLLLKRKPQEIARRILPMFYYDDPILTYYNQELWWEMDAYSVSDMLFNAKAVATPWGKYNWVRAPIKVYVSAYSGEVIFRIVDKNDPHARIAKKLFPRLFLKTIDLPKEKFLYPKVLFDLQSKLLGIYHEIKATSFYAGFNRREISQLDGTIEDIKNIFLWEKNRIAFQRTYTPLGKNIFAARLIGFIDDNEQKKLYFYESPSDLGIVGLAQSDAFLNQDQTFSSLSTLWGQRGSKISSSDAIFYPIGRTGIYLQTIFLESESISIPLATRFALIENTKVALGITIKELLDRSLDVLQQNNNLSLSEVQKLRAMILEAYRYYLEAEQARISGNTQEYQDNVDKIGVVLQKINL